MMCLTEFILPSLISYTAWMPLSPWWSYASGIRRFLLVVVKPCLSLSHSFCLTQIPSIQVVPGPLPCRYTTGSHTGDRKLGRQCMVACKQHIGGLRSSLVAIGQFKFGLRSSLVYGRWWAWGWGCGVGVRHRQRLVKFRLQQWLT